MPTSPDRIMDTIKRPKIGVGNIFEYSVCSKGRRFPVTLQMVRKPPVAIERMPMNPWGRNLLGREAQFRDVQAVAFFLGTTIAALPAQTKAKKTLIAGAGSMGDDRLLEITVNNDTNVRVEAP